MMNPAKTEAPVENPPGTWPLIWLILLGSFWVKCAAYFSVPFLSVFLSRNTSLPLPMIGLVVGLQPLAAFAGGFLGGHFSDSSRKRILLISLTGSTLTYLGFFLASQYLASSANAGLYFALLNLSAGWFASFFWPATQALLGDLTAEQQRPRLYRYRYVIANIGGGLGPVLGVALGLATAPTAFLATAAIYAALLVLLLSCPFPIDATLARQGARPVRSLRESFDVLRRDRPLRWLLLSAILFGSAYAQIESNLSQFLYREFSDGVQFFSLLIMLNAIGVIALQPLAALLESRLSASITMSVGTAVFCTGCLVIAALPGHKEAIALGILIITLGEVLVVPTLSVLIDQIAPEDMRGTYFGAATLRQLGPASGPFMGGIVLGGLGPVALFIFMAMLGGLSILFVRLSANRGASEHA